MKLIRLLLVVLLCAALPISGLAASGMAGDCPMHGHAAGSSVPVAATMHDCDMNDDTPSSQDTKEKGAGCNASAQCQIGSLYHPAPRADVERPAGRVQSVVFHYAQSLTVREPGGLWRPPRVV